jgi:hypothetical protein
MISEERIMGFVEGEGCFSITIQRVIDRRPRKRDKPSNIKRPYLFTIKPTFRMTISARDRQILEEARETLGFGQIYVQERSQKDPKCKDVAHYYAQGLKECLAAKDFFQRQTFYTKKGKDFELWCKALEIIKSGSHLEKAGILEICGIRDKMNKRASKGKWSAEAVEKILDAKPIHQTAHFDEKQEKLLHNENFDLQAWLKRKQGNSMKGKPELEVAQTPAKA